jgi:nucleoside phosphorylase
MKTDLGDWNSPASVGLPFPAVDLRDDRFYGDDKWKSKVKEALLNRFGPNKVPRYPLVTTAPTATSNVLVKNNKLLKAWTRAARHIRTIEMELGGVYAAARQLDHEYPILALRGISDIVGLKRHRDWTKFACNTAAAFLRALLHTRPIDPKSNTEQR